MLSIEQSLRKAKRRLVDAGLTDSPQLDAELLLGHALQKPRSYLFTWSDQILNEQQQHGFEQLLQSRLKGTPIAHIIGQREFWGLPLHVTADTLIPRPDTETLVEATLNRLLGCDACEVLDLGTGSGAIALALKSEQPKWKLYAVDQSEAALNVAKANAKQHQLMIDFIHSDWFSAIGAQRFDGIVSNPPYIEEQDPHLKQGDVRFEPISALTSGADGLKDIRTIITQAKAHLKPSGWLLLEHGYQQAEAVQSLLQQHGYDQIESVQDYNGHDRVTLGRNPLKTEPAEKEG